jgi:hypothetical protein
MTLEVNERHRADPKADPQVSRAGGRLLDPTPKLVTLSLVQG